MTPYDGQVFFMLWQYYRAKSGAATSGEHKRRFRTCCYAQEVIAMPRRRTAALHSTEPRK
jgi:hypothetical protein